MFDRFGDERRETREKEAERSGERIGGERRKEKTERREEVGKTATNGTIIGCYRSLFLSHSLRRWLLKVC